MDGHLIDWDVDLYFIAQRGGLWEKYEVKSKYGVKRYSAITSLYQLFFRKGGLLDPYDKEWLRKDFD